MTASSTSMTCHIELQPGERLSLPESLIDNIGPGRWTIIVQPDSSTNDAIRDHSAFLRSYSPHDEGLYNDCQRG